tara:strand:- start:1250 stop:2215 length:966 start_codon:yes stop_codon:yes gene_type:complete
MTKVGILGCGRQAPKHISGYKGNGINDIFVADVIEERAEEICKKYNAQCLKVEELVNRKDIDIYSICTPLFSHDEIILKLISNNKHFLCEKPLSMNPENIQRYDNETNAKNIIAMVGYIYKFSPAYQHLKNFLSSYQGYDKLNEGSVYMRIGGPLHPSPWQLDESSGGGVLNELVVHMIDLIHWLFGPILDINDVYKGSYRGLVEGSSKDKIDNYILLNLLTKDRLKVTIEADLITSDFIQFMQLSHNDLDALCSIQPNIPLRIEDKLNNVSINKYYDFENLYVSQIKYFLDCINKKIPHDRSTILDSKNICNVIEKIKSY